MKKPRVFLSHSSRDAATLRRLKDALVAKTGNTIEIFLSSDGQSIPLGRNWVHRIEEALEDSELMFVFLSPHSVKSQWVYFEAGYVYAKKVRVIPVGISGVDLSDLPAPMSLLQGYNLRSPDTLSNIIAILNDEFSHTHSESFSQEEYEHIFGGLSDAALSRWGVLADLVDSIEIRTGYPFDAVLSTVKTTLDGMGVPYQSSPTSLQISGAVLSGSERGVDVPIRVEIDPLLLPENLAILSELGRRLSQDGYKAGANFSVYFFPRVMPVGGDHKMTARFAQTPIQFGDSGLLSYKDLAFEFDYLSYRDDSRSHIIVRAWSDLTTASADLFAELIELLFERGVLVAND